MARTDFTAQPTEEQERLLEKLENVYLDAGVEAKGRVDMLALAGAPEAQVESLLAFLFAKGTLVKLNDDSFLHKDRLPEGAHRPGQSFQQQGNADPG